MPRKQPRRKHRNHTTKSKPKSEFPRPPRVGPAFDKLVAVMNRLRAPGGCPWDREQTHATLRTYLIEECYEVLDALESSDDAKTAEELGDLLLQILFHSQIASESSRFTIADVIREIYEKMIRRHPHVFGEKRAKDAAEVLRNWEIIKAEERMKKEAKDVKEAKEVKDASRSASSSSSTSSTSSTSSSSAPSILDGVPHTVPALLEALQLTRKAARIGFDWHHIDGIFAKLEEESHELRQALEQSPGTGTPPADAIESELGDLLFVLVNLARFLHIDPEIALKKTSAKFSRRFREMERLARAQGTTLAEVPRPQMEFLWDQAKLLEHH
jgi:tetrapyrrole methylase family protein / MazG family protein